MMLAPPVFKAMLTHSFREGEELRANGKVEIPLPDEDDLAFAVLMDVIHGKSRKVPREVEFDFLVDLALLVDKYQMQEPVAVYSDAWVDALKDRLILEILFGGSVLRGCLRGRKDLTS